MNIYITGSNGFIGKALLKKLSDNIDNKITALTSNKNLENFKNVNYKYINYDNMSNVDFQDCDLFIHLGSHSANHPYDSLANCLKYNVDYFLTFFDKLVLNGVKKFIIAGSCFEYGLSCLNKDFIDFNTDLLPINSYPISKAILNIKLLEKVKKNNDIKLKILRIFQCYGEGESESRLWPSLKRAAINGDNFKMTSGTQIRDFISVDEVVNHFINALSFSDYDNSPIISHVAHGEPKSLKQFVNYWWNFYGAKGEVLYNSYPSRGLEIPRIVSNSSSILYGKK